MSLPNFKLYHPSKSYFLRVVNRLMLSLSPLSFHADVSKTCIEVQHYPQNTRLWFPWHNTFVFIFLIVTSASTLWLPQLKKHLITACYVDGETSMWHEMAKNAWITVLGDTTSHYLAFLWLPFSLGKLLVHLASKIFLR